MLAFLGYAFPITAYVGALTWVRGAPPDSHAYNYALGLMLLALAAFTLSLTSFVGGCVISWNAYRLGSAGRGWPIYVAMISTSIGIAAWVAIIGVYTVAGLVNEGAI